MNMYEDDIGEEPPQTNIEEEEEDIPLEVMPNIILPKISVQSTSDPCFVKVVFIEAPNSFYLQLEKEEDYFDMFSKNLNEYYSKLIVDPLKSKDLPVLSTWAVFCNKWYRGVVLTKMNEEDAGCCVFKIKLIDFGYTKLVSMENIRYLEEEYTLDPPFVIWCALSEVYPVNKWIDKPWSKEALNCFADFCWSSERMKAIFMKDGGSGRCEVILETCDGQVVNEELVRRGFAFSKIIDGFSPELVSEDLSQIDLFHPSSHSTLKPKKNNCRKAADTDWDPMAAEYKNMASKGYVNDESAELVMNGFENDDKSICRYFRYRRGNCRNGDTCRWRHVLPRKDGLPSGGTLIYFNLEEEFPLPKVGSCCLATVTTINSPQEFYLQILSADSSAFIGNEEYRKSIKNLFLELHKNLTKMYTTSRGCLTPPLPAVGELMVAFSSSLPLEGYYRVKVLLVKETDIIMVKVFFIDVGMTEWVKESQLRPMIEQFLSPPALAIQCYLSDVSSSGPDGWDSEAKKLFSDYVTENLQTIIVTEVNEIMEDKIGVILLNTNSDKTVNESLVESGVAVVSNFISSKLVLQSLQI